MATLKELLSLAVKKDLIRVTTTRTFVRSGLTTWPRGRRDPFEIDQLKAFFQSEYYLSCARGGEVPDRHVRQPWRYWFPLLSLFSGMRPKEIFQMHVEDVKQTERGIWYFDIFATSDEDDERAPGLKKTTKTKTSRRQIPIHPELQKLGFLTFGGDQRKASDDPMLFRGITRDKYDDPASYPLRRFREAFLKKAIEMKPRQPHTSSGRRGATRFAASKPPRTS